MPFCGRETFDVERKGKKGLGNRGKRKRCAR